MRTNQLNFCIKTQAMIDLFRKIDTSLLGKVVLCCAVL
ncbi:hypothetical protein CLERM_138 [Coxiella-like endosymbiont]|nr:hypothetical protein CLERM_138 [Coxiella-like endosymbiont]